MTLIVDLSSNNPMPTDYKALKGAGVGAIIVKLTQDDNYYFEGAAEIIAKCGENDIAVGGYHFLNPATPVDAQLAWLHHHQNGLRRIFVDSELDDQGRPGAPTTPGGWYKVLVSTYEMLHGINNFAASGLYSNPEFLTGMVGAPWNYPLWQADYGVSKPDPRWQTLIWQFTDAHVFPGIGAPVDASWWRGNYTPEAVNTFFHP